MCLFTLLTMLSKTFYSEHILIFEISNEVNLDSHFKEVINLCTLRRCYGKKMDIYINFNFCY